MNCSNYKHKQINSKVNNVTWFKCYSSKTILSHNFMAINSFSLNNNIIIYCNLAKCNEFKKFKFTSDQKYVTKKQRFFIEKRVLNINLFIIKTEPSFGLNFLVYNKFLHFFILPMFINYFIYYLNFRFMQNLYFFMLYWVRFHSICCYRFFQNFQCEHRDY